MDQKKMAVTIGRVMQARAKLIGDNPFFGHLAMSLQLACGDCGTACTDGERLIIDPEFAQTLQTNQEMTFIILHEILHCALGHCIRGRSKNAQLYNIACDIVVNSTILEMWGLETIYVAGEKPMHLAPDGKEGRNYSAEEIYRMLLMKAQGDPDNAPVACGVVDRHDVWQAIKDQDRIRDVWDRRIRIAARSCQAGVGNGMTSVVRELVEKLHSRSKVNWRQLLHDFIQYDSYDYSFHPPDRRFSDGDFFLPAFNLVEEQGSAGNIWVCVDTSGSVSDEQLSEVMAEVRDAMRQAWLSGMASFFDWEITDPEPITTEEELRNLRPRGGGGTSYHVIFRYLREKLCPELPRAILIFTDGFGYRWPEEAEAMGVPVLWIISRGGNTDIPWGRVAEM